MTTARRLVIHGRVQGVWYRDWTVQAARSLGLRGWVRNCPDGTVEAMLEGDEETVREMVRRMHEGPPAARVDRIDEAAARVSGLAAFSRK